MNIRSYLYGSAIALATAVPAFAQDSDVTIVLNEDLETVEPCMTSQSNIGRVIQQNISETLVELNTSDGSLMPRLAESWEAVDEGTWRFALRQGVSFSDGSAFDAADVVQSYERAVSDKIACEIGAKYFGGMTLDMNVVDDHTLEITSDPAQPILPLLMSTLTIVPSETPFEFVQQPVGTGPYEMTERNVGQNITLERRDDYWGETPAVTKATYKFRSDDAVRAAMVATGEADIVPLIGQEQATNPATDFAYPNSETTYLRVDHGVAPLDDIRVRKAMNMAVDRDAFLGTLLPQDAVPATHMVPPSTLGFNSDLSPWPYDPDQARALLEEAKADGVPVDAEITMIARIGNFPNVTEVAEALTQMFGDVGFNVDLRMYEVAEWIDFYSKPFAEGRGPSVLLAMHDNSRGDPVFSMFFKYACEGLQSGFCSPELDQIMADATAATGDDRAAAWKEAFAMIHNDIVADVFLFHMVGFSRVAERLDFTPTIATNSELQLAQINFK
ncbi:ABC transporter substrate-binding protein [Primorskyibacter flagellatus]|uniref:Peptide/nickel transport system substrate-binding protein n=1 Tax=Primorskyibacter flagellatus TaxID=1387277 RepID=A0A1W2BY41_9RHOB|nr:ABC transporter substrate-binding protein [Primorskyibacter flagellatus]SMC77801.1 peptide/nickel transport system substrate-binding protein [Primorskyibacter flagellatus]